MEGRIKSLIIRSPRMDGLEYIITNMSGLFILVISTTFKMDKHGTRVYLHNGFGIKKEPDAEVYQIDLEKLVEIIERLGVSPGEWKE